MPGSPNIDIRYFSHKGWHIGVMLLLILNGFLVTLFVQCAFYDMDDIYEDFGTLPTIIVPLPLVINALFLQRHIFYDFVIVSNTLRIDSHTLSDVVENFSEVVRLRSEFAASLLQHLTQQELTIGDLQEELTARDTTGSGLIEVDDLRDVLTKFGFRLTRFRFNSVVKLLFELEGTTVVYAHVVHLVHMAQTENLLEAGSAQQQQPHPLLRPSVMVYDNVLGQSSIMLDWSSPASFVNVSLESTSLPKLSLPGTSAPTRQSNFPRPSVSSQALHNVFYLPPVGGPPTSFDTDPPTTPKKSSSNYSSARTLEMSEDDGVLLNHGFDRLDTSRTRDL